MKTIATISLLLCLAAVVSPQATATTQNPLIAKLAVPDRVHQVAFSPDGKLLAAGYGWNDGGIRIWDFADRKVVADLAVGKDNEEFNVETIAFSKDGKLFAGMNWHGDVTLWTVGSWKSGKTILTKQEDPKSLSFSPDSSKLAVATKKAVVIQDLKTGMSHRLTDIKTGNDEIVSAIFEGKSLIVFRDDLVQIWDVEVGRATKILKSSSAVFFGGTSPDGEYLVSGGGGCTAVRTLKCGL